MNRDVSPELQIAVTIGFVIGSAIAWGINAKIQRNKREEEQRRVARIMDELKPNLERLRAKLEQQRVDIEFQNLINRTF